MKTCLHISLLIFFSLGLQAQYQVSYNDRAVKAYNHLANLEFEKADSLILLMSKNEPNNLAYVHLENYRDFFYLFIQEDFDAFQRLEEKKEDRLQLLEKLDDNDPYKRFVSSEINLQWALIRSKFDQIFKAGREIYSAYKSLERNATEFPDFHYNLKSLSVIHSLIGTVSLPGIFKSILGFDATIEQGLAEMDLLLKQTNPQSFIFFEEAEASYMFMMLYQNNDKDSAIAFLNRSSMKKNKSPLASFVKTKLLQRAGYNEQAIAELSEALEITQAADFPYLYFLMGISQLRRLDDSAESYLNEFLQVFKGRHYIKEAYQKLAWHELVLNDNVAGYKSYLKSCTSNGYAMIDDDKQAQDEAEEGLIPNPILLKARLLYDGGYYQKAYKQLVKNAHHFYQNSEFELEYYYRIGRVTQALKNFPEAIQYFHQTINADEEGISYMSCNASLQMGLIYESQNDFEKAIRHFENCLKMSPDKYRNSLHQKAKSGLNRVK